MLEGWIKLPRKILESTIFKKKAEYFKIYIYIILKVNHADGLFSKGSNRFNFKDEIRDIPSVSLNQVYEFLRWAKKNKIISTSKTTRGVIITVENWDELYGSENKNSQVRKQFNTNINTTQEQLSSNTINNNKKNINNYTIKEEFDWSNYE